MALGFSLLADQSRVLTQPAFQPLEPERAALVKSDQELKCLDVVKFQDVPVHPTKGSRHRDGCTLVAVDEGMILREAFPQRGGFLNQVFVVTGLRASADSSAPRSRIPRLPPNRAINRP